MISVTRYHVSLAIRALKLTMSARSRINNSAAIFMSIIVGTMSSSRHFSLLNVNAAGACGYDFPCDGGRPVRAYLRRRRGTI